MKAAWFIVRALRCVWSALDAVAAAIIGFIIGIFAGIFIAIVLPFSFAIDAANDRDPFPASDEEDD